MALLLTKVQSQILDLKNQGISNTEIGKIVYPNSKRDNGRVMVSRQLNSEAVVNYLSASKDQALKLKNITWLKIISKLGIMLDANKNVYDKEGSLIETIPDIQQQQFAIKTLIPMLSDDVVPEQLGGNKALAEALKAGDEVELQRIVFNKSDPDKSI